MFDSLPNNLPPSPNLGEPPTPPVVPADPSLVPKDSQDSAPAVVRQSGLGEPSSTSLGGPNSPGLAAEEFISVMPVQFRLGKNKKAKLSINPDITNSDTLLVQPKKRKTTLIIIIIAAVVLLAAAAGFYLWARNYLKLPKNPIINQPSNNQPATSVTPELSLTAEIKDVNQQNLSTAKLDFPTGSLSKDQAPLTLSATSTPDLTTITDKTYQYLGGVYRVGPSLPAITSASFAITYASALLQGGSWEADIKMAYLQNSSWVVVSDAVLNLGSKTMTATFNNALPSDTFALVVDRSKMQTSSPEVQIAPSIFSSADQDSDGLTDVEEKIYQTDPAKADTDGNGQADGLGVAVLSDPLHATGTLILSGLVKVYTNNSWSYSLFYPSSWLVKPLPETDLSDIMVVTNTSEFFEISVQANMQRLTPREWYLKISSQVDPSQLVDTIVAGQPAVWSPDHLSVYVGNVDKMYILSYNLGAEQEANFKTTFKMFIKSFQFLTGQQAATENMPAGDYRGNRPDGTIIKYATSPAVYIIQGGLKSAIPSEAVLTKLGHTFNDVVTIPDQEWYPDGLVAQ
jgi:hypothetical protein